MKAEQPISGSDSQVKSSEEELLRIPGAVVHLIDGQESVHLATGDFSLVRLKQDGDVIAVFAKVGEEGLQWPLTRDETTGKLDSRHYFFSLKVPPEVDDTSEEEKRQDGDGAALNYGMTFASEGNLDAQLGELDKYLEQYSYFSAPAVVGKPEKEEEKKKCGWGLLGDYVFRRPKGAAINSDSTVPVKIGPSEGENSEKQQLVEETSAAYWTLLAPNVEDYSSSLAKGIALGSGHIIKGIFWCSDATISQLQKGGVYMRDYVKQKGTPSPVSPRTMRNIRRAKRMSKMTEKVAKGVLTGIVTTSGIVTGSLIKSKAGKKFFKLLPGEVALASLDAFGKVFDAVELAGKNVFNTTNSVTCGIVSHRYGEEAGEAAKETLSTAGHVFATAWTVSKIRKALNPKNGGKMSKTALAKSAGKVVLKG